ncbi:MAG: hypothetical protein FVQ82_09090 [Planctomycetes bacterium]|nr:hypothetical protein [Planctomycetota bacterium]
MDDLERKNVGRFTIAAMLLLAVFSLSAVFGLNEPDAVEGDVSGTSAKDTLDDSSGSPVEAIAAVISVKGMIDDGLLKSIERRSEEAIAMGASYLIYEIDTYGGFVISGHQISDYLILKAGKRAHTIAYVPTKAISAGAMISVACKDIIMVNHTTIGDCAPITMGAELKDTEREKSESFIRGIFSRSAEANGYPEALLKAMVTQRIEVFRVKKFSTGELKFFETPDLPKDPNAWEIANDPNAWDTANKELIVSDKEILTLTAEQAEEYGIARTQVDDLDGVLTFLEGRDKVVFSQKPIVMEMLWSEQMVRWISSPAVMGVLVLLAMLGAYIELNSPGLGLPGLVAVICIVIIIGSKFLVGLANWIEIAVFIVGIILLLVEIFVIPGFGIAGITGIACIIAGGFGMLIKNEPGEIPWPSWEVGGWSALLDSLVGVSLGFAGFVFIAILFARYLPKISVFRRLTLQAVTKGGATAPIISTPPQEKSTKLAVDDIGIVVATLRPAGQAQFEKAIADVVTEGEFIDKGQTVMITEIHGNRVVVRKAN